MPRHRPLTARDVLRTRTRDLHAAAEAALDPDRRLASLAAYADLLERLWALHAGVAEALEACPGGDPRLAASARGRIARLEADLADLTGRPPARPLAGIALAGSAEALGAAYVIEGSALGGRVLHRQAQARLGVTAAHGARFLADGDGLAGWRLVVERLSALPAADPGCEAVEAGARRVFGAFVAGLAGA